MANTYLDNLIVRRDNIAAELAAITLSKPDNSIDGESQSHASNRAALIAELKDLNEIIAQQQGPCIVYHTGR
mgnify:CR=1 FL=1